MGGEPGVFYQMLGNLEQMNLNKALKEITPAIEKLDYA